MHKQTTHTDTQIQTNRHRHRNTPLTQGSRHLPSPLQSTAKPPNNPHLAGYEAPEALKWANRFSSGERSNTATTATPGGGGAASAPMPGMLAIVTCIVCVDTREDSVKEVRSEEKRQGSVKQTIRCQKIQPAVITFFFSRFFFFLGHFSLVTIA